VTDDERARVRAETNRLMSQAEATLRRMRGERALTLVGVRHEAAKAEPERPLAKVLEFRPRSA
jgi:hypothetical protein